MIGDNQVVRPDPTAAAELRRMAVAGASLAAYGRQVAACGYQLTIQIPLNTPACCRRHACNHVRHEGTTYDSVLADRRDAKGHSSADAGYSELHRRLNLRIAQALMEAGRWPDAEECEMRRR
jgi:hypothetical protein